MILALRRKFLAQVAVLTLAALFGACTQSAIGAREAFCEDVVGILSDGSIGDSPERLRAQMISVQEVAARLDEPDKEDLLILIDQLNGTLEAAGAGEATSSGWSSGDVVREVEELCPQASGLVSWVVQP